MVKSIKQSHVLILKILLTVRTPAISETRNEENNTENRTSIKIVYTLSL